MNATITYTIAYVLHPWKIVRPEHGPAREEPVASFDYDSEAEMFQGHVYAAGLDGKLVVLDADVTELFRLRELNRKAVAP